MKAYGVVDVLNHIFLTSALAGSEWLALGPGRFTSGRKSRGTHWKGGWVVPRAFLGEVKRRKFLTLQGLKLRNLDRPASSQSLYRPRHPVSPLNIVCI
jgi:hypothetical protein